LHQPQAAQSQLQQPLILRAACAKQRGDKRVAGLGAVACRPPECGPRHVECVAYLWRGGQRQLVKQGARRVEQPQRNLHAIQRRCACFQLHAHRQRGARQVDIQRSGAVERSDAGRAKLQAYGPPGAGGQQARPPVPAVVVLRLAHIEAAGVAIPERAAAQLGLQRLPVAQCGGKLDVQHVAARAQQSCHAYPLRHKHVVARQELRAVEPDGRHGVEAVEAERRWLGGVRVGERERAAVEPVDRCWEPLRSSMRRA